MLRNLHRPMIFRPDSKLLHRPGDLPSAMGRVVLALGLAAGCAAAAWISQAFAVMPGGRLPVVDLSAGVAVAGLLLGGNRLWPGIAIGALLGNPQFAEALKGSPAALTFVLVAASAAVLQAIAAATLFRSVAGIDLPFFRAHDAGWFVVLAGLICSLIAPSISSTAALSVGQLAWGQFGATWLASWLSNVSGVLLAAPLVLALATSRNPRLGPWQGPELILLAVAPFVIGLAIVSSRYPIEYLYLPLLAWAAFRFGPHGATALTVCVAAIVVATTIRGHGSFVGESHAVTLLLLESFIGTVGTSTLVLLGVIAQRDTAERGLADATATLETRVRLRTQELAAANGRLRRIADLDGLTGVANRRFFDGALDVEWRRAVQGTQSLCVILMDVDYFKNFNDTYGHPAGDECLQAIAEALNGGLQRTGEILARYGGEEFVVLLPNVNASEGLRTAERLRQQVAALAIPHRMPSEGSFVSMSAGVSSLVPTRGTSPADLLASADAGLYAAKRAGRNRTSPGT